MRIKTIVNKSYTNSYWRVGLHLLFWLLLFFGTYYINTISFGWMSTSSTTYLLVAKNTIALMIFYYLLMYYIWPRFLQQNKLLTGAGLLILLIFLYAWIDSYFDKQMINNCSSCLASLSKINSAYYGFLQGSVWQMIAARLFSLGLLYQLLILLSLPVAIKIGRSYFRQTIQQLQLSKDNLQLEFNFLKSQINPHFLFNTLNNIYSLVEHDKKQQATATIARLSGFMRYTLYECNEDKIELDKEIQLFRDYIELEQLRLNQTEVQFNYSTDAGNYRIPPLLFMPALENAFKYSADNLPGGYINIDIFVKEKRLMFRISNRFDPQRTNKPGGIGLVNMQKRLQYYYPDRHSYLVTMNESVYSLEITCDLS